MATEGQRRLADTFDSVADLYERARPTYPPALFDDLARLGALRPGSRILEIGCGTGQATRHLAERGWTVRGLEPGKQLARVARRVLAAYPTVDIDVQKFESWSSEVDFDMVLAATSWHWVDPSVAYRHAADLLRLGGALAIVTTDHVLPEGGDAFFVEVGAVYRAIGEDDGRDRPSKPDEVDRPLLDALTSTGLFDQPNLRTYLSPTTYTAQQYVEVLGTYSNHIAMDEPDRALLFDRVRAMINSRPGGKITKHYLNTLYVARCRA